MSTSLDKLRALTSKLEEKLEQKQKKEVQPTQATIAATPLAEIKQETPAKTPQPEQAPEATPPPLFTPKHTSETVRDANIDRLRTLYEKLNIHEKSPSFENIFHYKAMNLSGIGLKEEDFGQVREGKYIQVIAITYEPDKNGKKKAKNVSLGYFGKAEKLDEGLKNEIIEFVLRWRYEKAFQNVEHYKALIEMVDTP